MSIFHMLRFKDCIYSLNWYFIKLQPRIGLSFECDKNSRSWWCCLFCEGPPGRYFVTIINPSCLKALHLLLECFPFTQMSARRGKRATQHMLNESLPCACVSCSGRPEQPALTARAPAPHPGFPLAPEKSYLRPRGPEGGFLPPADPLPVCVIKEKHNPSVSPLSLSVPGVLPRNNLGPPSASCVKLRLFLGKT